MKSEDVLQALKETLSGITGVTVERNSAIPEEIPEGGLIIIRDGDPGTPDEVIGFSDVYYAHQIEVEAYVSNADQETRDEEWNSLMAAIGTALEGDRTLGGEVAGFSYSQPAPLTEPVEGGHDIKSAVIELTAEYYASSPLA